MGIEADSKPLPAVHDTGSYVDLRVSDQIRNYYDSKAAIYEGRVRRLRAAGDLLGVTAVVLAAVAAAFGVGALAAWVPVVTTIGTSAAVHIAAARYDHLVIEFLRTSQRLEHLCREFRDNPGQDPAAFIDACEAAISVENQAWMARWDAPDQDK